MRPTEDEKKRFLEYIRAGDDRATAAWRIDPEYTGTMFRSMCNTTAAGSYDPEFHAAYDQAVLDRGPLDPNRQQIWGEERASNPVTASGHVKAMHLSRDQLEAFLDLVRDGVQFKAAADSIEPRTSITQINRRAAKDPDFAREYREAKEEGYAAYQEALRTEATRQAFAGDYRALRDQLLMHTPEAKALMTSKHELTGLDGGAIELFAKKNFPDLPPEMLDEMIRLLEEKEMKQLGSGGS